MKTVVQNRSLFDGILNILISLILHRLSRVLKVIAMHVLSFFLEFDCIGSWSLSFHLLCISLLLCLCRVVALNSLPVHSLNVRMSPVLRDCIYNHFS